jgi:hypothetical protein
MRTKRQQHQGDDDGGKGNGDRVKKGDGKDGNVGNNSNNDDNGDNGNDGDSGIKQRQCCRW